MRSPVEMNKVDLTRSPRPKKKRILVVEDQDNKRNLLRLALGEYDVAAIGDYDTGLRMAKRQYFDLYILDNQIPGGTGIELCRRIREFDPNTPILFCSGSADCLATLALPEFLRRHPECAAGQVKAPAGEPPAKPKRKASKRSSAKKAVKKPAKKVAKRKAGAGRQSVAKPAAGRKAKKGAKKKGARTK
jgi:CheY-like chemotaxis protein